MSGEDDWASAINEQVENLNIENAPNEAVAASGNDNAAEEQVENVEEVAPNQADISILNKLLHKKLQEGKNVNLEILRQNPSSPLYSVKSFKELPLKPELLNGVYDMGFTYPSKIQETTLPALLADPPQNMIAQSQSGTGKTAAFVLTMLSRVSPSQPGPQCLCLAPTYELSLQIGEVVKEMGKFLPDITMRYAIRGERVQRGEKVTEHIIVGTPGTVLDWCHKFRSLDTKGVKVFVLDEADVMIATQGHHDQSVRIKKFLNPDAQMLLFSATYDNEVMKFAEHLIPNPIIIRLRREEETLDNITQIYMECECKEAKFNAISNIYGALTIGAAIIFCHTKKTANWLMEEMQKEGHSVGLLTGELTVQERANSIQRFRDAKERVLITTNIIARGLDVEHVKLVVNFDLPMNMKGGADCETYLHRIGRTGRFGKNGLAVNMVDGPRSRGILQQIKDHFKCEMQKVDGQDLEEIEKLGI